MRRLFISDLHLEDKRPDITRAFFHLLDRFTDKVDELYILGDFFEIWLGDDALTPTAQEVASRLNRFSAHARIFILHGNRDFLIGEHYASQCGAKLIHEPHLIQIQGKNTLLMHGDTLCTEDTQYMDFRKMVRNPDWQNAFLSQSVEERIAFGRQVRAQSQEDTKEKSDEILDVTPAEVIRVVEEHQAHWFIHGHTHRPSRHILEAQNAERTVLGERIVLGDWHEKGWYVYSDDTRLELQSFAF